MHKVFLITRPNHDLITNYLFRWSFPVVNEAAGRNFQVLDLKEKKATRENLESYINKNEPALVFFNGHGSSKVICGYDDEVLVEADKNEGLLSDTVVYARICRAAECLGSRCVQAGTVAFVGYNRDYFLGYSQSRITRPLEDGVAKLFLEPSNLVPTSLLKGNTVEESFSKSQEAMRRNIRFMNSGSALSSQKDAAPYLWRNVKSQTVHGNQKANLC